MKIIKYTLQYTESCLLVGQVILISIFVRIYYLASVYLENTDVYCVRPTRNSNLSKSAFPDVSNGKANISSDSYYCNEFNQDRKINSRVGLFRTINSTGLHRLLLSFIQRRRSG